MQQIDVLIIGSGIAGLTYALKTSQHFPHKTIAVFTKGNENESNTKYAQGGIATVMDFENDSFEQHITDTLIAGDGYCDPQVVSMVVREAPKRLQELIEWGTRFDKTSEGSYDFGLEGGHSRNRILHFKDITGLEIEQKLLKQVHKNRNIYLYPNHLALDLILNPDKNKCMGAYILNTETEEVVACHASVTMLATGGSGQIYRHTTNPNVATGDGIAIGYRAGAKVKHMEFIQFHPTALYHEDFQPSFLISEAVRGFGAILKNCFGEPFMHRYDPRRDLAPRDVVARAIHSEMQKTNSPFVYLDATHLEAYEFRKHFPVITQTLAGIGIHVQKDMIPVTPAAHYMCGGIEVNQFGETSIAHLLACGECACTGLHGANRLASNSLLEALVFAHRSFLKTIEYLNQKETFAINHTFIHHASARLALSKPEFLKNEIREIMSQSVNIVRRTEELEKALEKLHYIEKNIESLYRNHVLTPGLIEAKNMATVAILVTSYSLKRRENKGTFYSVSLCS